MNMISVILKKNNKDEITSVRITLNGNVITLDYSEYQELITAMSYPEIVNYRGEKFN